MTTDAIAGTLIDPPPGGWSQWDKFILIDDDGKIIDLKVRFEYYGFDASADGALAVVDGNRRQAIFDVVQAVLKYLGKDYGNDAVNTLLKGDKDTLDEAWDSEKKQYQIGKIIQEEMKIREGPVETGDSKGFFYYLVEIANSVGNGYKKIKDGAPLVPHTYDFFGDPRVREVGCIHAKTFEEDYKNLLRGLMGFQKQVDDFKNKGGIIDLDLKEEMKNLRECLLIFENVCGTLGQGYNVAAPDRWDPASLQYTSPENLASWSFFANLIGGEAPPTNAKIYIGVNYNYEVLFMNLEVDQPYDLRVGPQGEQVPVTPLIRLDLTQPALVRAGVFIKDDSESVEGTLPRNRVRINLMAGLERLQPYKRSMALLMRMRQFYEDYDRVKTVAEPQFLRVLPKYIIDFPIPDQSNYGEIQVEVPEDEERPEDALNAAEQRRKRRQSALQMKQKTEVSETMGNFKDALATISEIQEYYGKLLNLLNIQGLMRTVISCYVGENDFVDLFNAWCKSVIKIALEQAFEPSVGFYVHGIIESEDLTEDERMEALTELSDTFGTPVKVIINAVLGGLGAIDDIASNMGPQNLEPPISTAIAEDFGAGPQYINQVHPNLGAAQDTQAYGGEIQQIASNSEKVGQFINQIQKYLDLSDVCDKISKSIPSLPNLLSVQSFGGRPGGVGAMDGLFDGDYWADRFQFPSPPKVSYPSDFSMQDLLGFVGQSIATTLEKTALQAIQSVFNGLMQDWLEACQRGNDEGLTEEDQAAQGVLDGQTPEGMPNLGTIIGGATAAPPDFQQFFRDMTEGLAKDELCQLLKGSPGVSLLNLLEFRLKSKYSELFYGGWSRFTIKYFFAEAGRIIDETPYPNKSRGLWWCDEPIIKDKGSNPHKSARQCLDPTVENAERQQMRAEGVPEDIINDILDSRREARLARLSELMKNLVTDQFIPPVITAPPLQLDNPYLSNLIRDNITAAYSPIFDGLVGELSSFRTLNLERKAEDRVNVSYEDLQDFSNDDSYSESNQYTRVDENGPSGPLNQSLVAVADANYLVNSLVREAVAGDPLSENETYSFTLDGTFDVLTEIMTNGAAFTVQVFKEAVPLGSGETPGVQDIFTTITTNNEDIDGIISGSQLLGDYTPDKTWNQTIGPDGDYDKNFVEYTTKIVVESNFRSFLSNIEASIVYEEANEDKQAPFVLASLLPPVVDSLEEYLPKAGRATVNQVFLEKIRQSRLFQASNFAQLDFVGGDKCTDVFERVNFVSLDDIISRAMQDYQRVLKANLGELNTTTTVMSNQLITTLVEVYIYEFLLSFVYFGDEVETSFFAGDAFKGAIATLLIDDVDKELSRSTNAGVKQGFATLEDFYTAVINIPWIESDKFPSRLRFNVNNTKFSKRYLAMKIIEEIAAQTVNDGKVFTQFQKIYQNIEDSSIFDFSMDDLQSLIYGKTLENFQIENTRSHFGALINERLAEGTPPETIVNLLSNYLPDGPEFTFSHDRKMQEMFENGPDSDFLVEPYIKATTLDTDEDIVFSYLDLPFLLNRSVEFQGEELSLAKLWAWIGSGLVGEDEGNNKFKQLDVDNLKNFKTGVRVSYVDAGQLGQIYEPLEGEGTFKRASLLRKTFTQGYNVRFEDDSSNVLYSQNPQFKMAFFPLFEKEKLVAATGEEFLSLDVLGQALVSGGYIGGKTYAKYALNHVSTMATSAKLVDKDTGDPVYLNISPHGTHWSNWILVGDAPTPGQSYYGGEGQGCPSYAPVQGPHPVTGEPWCFPEGGPTWQDFQAPPGQPASVTSVDNNIWMGQPEGWVKGEPSVTVVCPINFPIHAPNPITGEPWCFPEGAQEQLAGDLQDLLDFSPTGQLKVEAGDTGEPNKFNLMPLIHESMNSDEFNLIFRLMFTGSELMTAYRLFLMFNNLDPRFAGFGNYSTALGSTKGTVLSSYSTVCYGSESTSLTQQAEEIEAGNFKNTEAALKQIAMKTVPMMVKGILEMYDPGFITLKILKGIPPTGAVEEDNVISYTIPDSIPIPPLVFITTPLGLLYAAVDEGMKDKPKIEEEECPDEPLTVEGALSALSYTAQAAAEGMAEETPTEETPTEETPTEETEAGYAATFVETGEQIGTSMPWVLPLDYGLAHVGFCPEGYKMMNGNELSVANGIPQGHPACFWKGPNGDLSMGEP